MLWYGTYRGTLTKLIVVKPIPELPNLFHLTFADNVSYRTILAIFDDAVMVTDAPAHQSKLIIQYVQETFHRSVTHLLVSHQYQFSHQAPWCVFLRRTNDQKGYSPSPLVSISKNFLLPIRTSQHCFFPLAFFSLLFTSLHPRRHADAQRSVLKVPS